MNFFCKDRFYVFGERYIELPFQDYRNSISRGVVLIANYKLESRVLEYNVNTIVDYHLNKNNFTV